MRRHARTRVRRLVQLGVRAARRQARGGPPGRDRRTVRLQPRAGDPGRSRKHAAAGPSDPGRTGCRLDGDRPGRGAGEPRCEMATVAATIADGGRRPQPTFVTGAAPRVRRTGAASAAVARTVRHLMIGVVREGTGTAAAIPGVTVAGKTGTAELKTPMHDAAGRTGGEARRRRSRQGSLSGRRSEASNTDAWFAAFAPALHPRIVGVRAARQRRRRRRHRRPGRARSARGRPCEGGQSRRRARPRPSRRVVRVRRS